MQVRSISFQQKPEEVTPVLQDVLITLTLLVRKLCSIHPLSTGNMPRLASWFNWSTWLGTEAAGDGREEQDPFLGAHPTLQSPTQCSSPCFSAAGVSSLSFTIHALIFLKGHRHEEKTLLNIPALQDSSPGLI
ncbi:hypothetical protein AV530_015694 [Patagioenas fasciata monilis]|uniref:Uncharacterized protein n=1 Tax=Patagioenas fasciata monilis TaxID=372326 RepID=A0A1V4KIF9_PATFA|nr:hypothetical protein AV530_015694 [Patagioenas fasciata monilis]